jgi:hypothetical protein
VTILEMFPALNDGGNILQGQAIHIELDRLGVTLALGRKPSRSRPRASSGKASAGQSCTRRTPSSPPSHEAAARSADALRFCAPEFYQIGDCVTPKNIAEATRSAHFAALDLGRY